MITIDKLNGLQREMIWQHLLALSEEDLALRFGHYLSSEKLLEYANKVNFNRDIVLGAFDTQGTMVGFCHSVGYLEHGMPQADIGVSVIGNQRGQGVGLRLLQASFDLAASRGIFNIHIYTLKRNFPMYRLMKKLGGSLIIEDYEITMNFNLKKIEEHEKMEHFFTDNGIEVIRKIVNPHAKTILFIHGAGGDAWQWRCFFMPYFAKAGLNSIAISLPNHGQSKKDESYELEDYINIVAQAHTMAGDNSIIIGHSMGGFLVQKYAADRDIENKIILLASMPPFNPTNLESGFLATIQDSLKDDQARNHLGRLLASAPIIDTENIKSPIVMFAGIQDTVIPLKWEQKISHHYRVPLHEVEGGHNLMIGRHWRNVADMVAEHI